MNEIEGAFTTDAAEDLGRQVPLPGANSVALHVGLPADLLRNSPIPRMLEEELRRRLADLDIEVVIWPAPPEYRPPTIAVSYHHGGWWHESPTWRVVKEGDRYGVTMLD